MAQKDSFVKQASVLAIAGLVVKFLGFLYRIPLTAMIGDVGNGIYSVSFNIYALFLIISSAALPSTIGKLVSESRAKNQYKNSHRIFIIAMRISVIMGISSMLILFFGATKIEEFTEISGSAISIRVLAPTVLVVGIMSVYRGYFQGMKNTVPTAVSQIIEQVFNAVFSLVCAYVLIKVSIEWGVAGGIMGTLIGAVSGLLFLVVLYNMIKPRIKKEEKKGDRTLESDKEIAKKIVYTAIPIIIGSVVFSISNLIDMKMCMSRLLVSGNYTAEEATALYGQLAGKYNVITNLPISISSAFATAMIPNLASDRIGSSKRDINRKINMGIKITMIISIPSAVGISVLAEPILMFLYPAYPEGSMLLVVGAFSIIFISFTQILTGVLQGMSLLYVPVFATIIGVIAKLPINYYLIAMPKFNVVGAVISTIVCFVITSIINYAVLKNKLKIKLDTKNIIVKPVACAVVMGVVCKYMFDLLFGISGSNALALIVSILVGVLVYFVGIIITKTIPPKELRQMPYVNRLLDKIK